MAIPPLPDGFTIRRPTVADLDDVLNLYNSFDIPKYGRPNQSLASIHTRWTAPDFDLATDAWLVVAPDGQMAGYIQVFPDDATSSFTSGGVHPAYQQRGIGTHLQRLAQTRVQQGTAHLPLHTPVTIQSFCLAKPINEAEARLLTREEYYVVRHFWDMELELLNPPPRPIWPFKITIRTFQPEQDEHMLYRVFNEVFQDVWGYTQQTFENWMYENLTVPSFDPTLCLLACQEESIVGFAMCEESGEMGIINSLGVTRGWRKNGLGQALLLHSFDTFAQRGIQTAHLSVDADSLTGATRLYERAGMRAMLRQDLYRKTLARE